MKNTIECVPSNECTGCGACYNKCPVSAIKMEYDSEGFLFPTVTSACVDCGQCKAVCPALNPVEHFDTPESYAVWASDEIRLKSSSGGMFSILANYVLANGGAVCGAAYTDDYMYVHHIWAESEEELAPLRGSKYVQSDTELTFKQAKKYLDSGRMVLYTGCACQIAGLYNFLGKEYENLYTADLVCHGSNSVTAYQSFIKEFSGGEEIEKVDFRDKVHFPWSTPQVIYLKNGEVKKATWNEGAWYNGISEGVTTRNNCYECPYAKAERIADITMADCWQVHRINPKLDDNKGTSLVLVNSPKGKKLFKKLKSDMKLCEKVPLPEVRKYNGQLNWPIPAHPSRKYFFSHLDQGYHKALWYGRGMRFDVGLVGWWFASNYGSALTYYALGNVLSDLGKQTILVKLPTKSGASWDSDTKISIDFLGKYFKITGDRDFSRLHEVNHFCDAFMLGSDQMWRVDSLRLVGYSFFLDFVEKNKKKIAFSTSFGNEHFSDDEELTETAGDFLRRFDAISVREKSGIDVCRREFGVDAEQILDPVFLCKKEAYERATKDVHDEVPKKYLLCYILDPNPEKQEAAKSIAEKQGLEIITILGMKEYANAINNWNVGTVLPKVSPEQFLYYIKNCSYLMTDSHHGTCFGIIFEKPYAAIVNAHRGATRFETVADVLGLKDRLFYNALDICNSKKPYEDIDYGKVANRLQLESDRGMNWLKNALSCPSKQNEETARTLKVVEDRKNTLPNPKRTDKDGDAVLINAERDKLNKDPDFVKIRMLATLLRDYGIKHVVLSPGGRDVPIVRMFENNEGTFTIHRVTDERSAGYYGLGIAAQLQEPVACVCTSGTAASNYLPAVTEAYFTGVPLIMITADRREVYHGQGEDQTIPQKHIYDGVVKKSISLPEGSGYHADYQTRRDIQDCILETTHNGFGPVHINVTIDNIAVGATAPKSCWALLPKINPHILRVSPCDGDAQMMKWVEALKKSKRILVVYGQNTQPTKKQLENIERFASKYNCVIVTDHIANLNSEYSLKPFNMLASLPNKEFNENLAPDILITVGGKSLMNDPLTYKVRGGPGNIRHWSVTPDGKIKDFFFRLSSVLEMSQDYFFEWFADHAGKISNNGNYLNQWKKFNDRCKTPVENTFNSLYIQSKFLPAIPDNSLLHLAVGQTFFFCRKYDIKPSVQVFCNMGTNGIDGCTSTFMGQCAVAKDKRCFLLVGDLSFFYDMNGLWNKTLNKNIRILLVNNGGSGLLGNHGLKAIRAAHNTEAKGWVEAVGFEYVSARNEKEFEEKLQYFLSDRPKKALFFEVFCK